MSIPETRVQIEERVKEIAAEALLVDKSLLKSTAKLIDELNADSLGLAELLMNIESEFEVHISDEEAREIKTIEALVDFIYKRKKA